MTGRPRLGTLAVRNVTHRPGEALTIVLGAMLGTAVIVAAFVVGDSFSGSIRDVARTELGPIDEQVQVRTTDDAAAVAGAAPSMDADRVIAELDDAVRHDPPPGTDGLLTSTSSAVVLSNGRTGDALDVLPAACALEVDFASGRRFGGDAAASGLSDAGSNPQTDQVVLSDIAARGLDLGVGDRLTMTAFGSSRSLIVRTVVATVGIAGRCDAMVADGTLGPMYAARPASSSSAQAPARQLWVSNRGGVFDGADDSDAVVAHLTAIVERNDHARGLADVQPVKQDLLRNADRQGANLTSLFSGIGGFSVISGILLVVNLFVMLAEERKVSIGVMRAIGTKRRHVFGGFLLEGALYTVAATVAGVAVGIGVGWAVVRATSGIFSERDDDFVVSLFVRPDSLLLAGGIGAAIALVTIAATSIRISRLNVIAAIRDLPGPAAGDRRPLRRLAAIAAVAAGVATLFVGPATLLVAGVPTAAGCTAALLPRRWRRNGVVIACGSIAIGWPLLAFAVLPQRLDRPGIAVFVVMGVFSVTGAVAIAVSADTVWRRLIGGLAVRGRGLPLRLGLAYPLARRFRTGLLCAMFGLIVFTLAFLAAFGAILATQRASSAADMAAGMQLHVTSNRSDPLDAPTLQRIDGVDTVATTLRAGPQWVAPRYASEPTRWAVSGIDASFLQRGAPALSRRSARYPDDRSVFEALLSDPTLVVVDDSFLVRGGGPQDAGPAIGDRVALIDPSGAHHDLTVVAVLRSDFVFAGAFLQRDAISDWMGARVTTGQSYVGVSAGHDPDAVATAINRALLDRGADARSFERVVDDGLRTTKGFIGLLQGYLAVGLLIGIAGLGVVMVRAVRERRREIGMLRSMGTTTGTIRAAFFTESLVVTVTAIVIGVVLGLVTAWQVVVNSSAFSNATVSFVVPWGALWWIVGAPLAGASAATLVPARRAARTRPAEALRVAD